MTSDQKEKRRNIWAHHIKQWKLSNQTQAEYCRKCNLNNKNFYYWKKKFNSTGKSISFVQLPIPEYLPDVKNINFINSLKVLLNNDIKIEISENFNPMTLKKVVETLRSIG
ncbi:hypothetical protein HY745_12535 [Candidatus Desantisbacteria bacterium]|nr:hypothetical protein [Candidatus Desantisbacteria bacterium]